MNQRVCERTGQGLEQAFGRPKSLTTPGPTGSRLEGMILEGKYKLLRKIGAGGMGQVFEAEDLRSGGLVAIKLVGQDGPPQALVRLEREARIVATLRNPNICEVYDVGHMPYGAPFVVFERLVGETLAQRTRSVLQLPLRSTIDLFSQMLLGLQAAHDAHIIHRDLKPENIFLVDREGGGPLVKLLDFGFAKDLSVVSRVTRPGDACGTLKYMSPEQLRVEPLSPRSDLFAVGLMLYETLAGRHPFAAASQVEMQRNILCTTPRPIRVRRPALPEALEDLLVRALAKAPADRPASALELRRDLLSVTTNSHALPSFADQEPSSVTEPAWLAPSYSPLA